MKFGMGGYVSNITHYAKILNNCLILASRQIENAIIAQFRFQFFDDILG